MKYIKEGRKILVTRTFSKIYGMAGLRLGYGIAPPEMIDEMRTYATGSVNALVRWGGVAALEDHASEKYVRDTTIKLREATMADLRDQGFEVIPSETNFFMVHTGRPGIRGAGRIPEARRCGGTRLPADARLPARVDRDRRRDEALHGGLERDLSGRDEGDRFPVTTASQGGLRGASTATGIP